MAEQKPTGTELLEGIDLHPRHESWIRISTHHNLIAVGISLAVAALFIIVITLRFSVSSIAALGVLAAPVLVWLIWRSTPQRRRGFSFLGNAGLTVRIKADLITELGASDVNVDSSNGVVTLRGTVPFADFREAAEHLARQRGARQVTNELKVVAPGHEQPAPYLPGFAGVTTSEGAPVVAAREPLEQSVREALEADPRVNAYVLVVRVDDGVAYLTGRQETVQASDAATAVAVHVPGILAVNNDLEILPSY